MQKIVINSCYGGFGLSPVATKEYLKLKGKECFFYVDDFSNGYTKNLKVKVNISKITSLFFHTYIKDSGDSFIKCPSDKYYFWDKDIKRDDPDLIKVIKKLGSKKASGQCAELTIVEIPDDVGWEIKEYDGFEHVAEKHRAWS